MIVVSTKEPKEEKTDVVSRLLAENELDASPHFAVEEDPAAVAFKGYFSSNCGLALSKESEFHFPTVPDKSSGSCKTT